MKIVKNNIAAAIILFNPNERINKIIQTLLENINLLILIDNSKNSKIALNLSNTNDYEYIINKTNIGIAVALNQAANLAIKEGFDFLLTMDQDSLPDEQMLDKMIGVMNEIDLSDIGIISPVHVNKYNTQKVDETRFSYKFDVMTSGNLINLKIFSKLGGFNDNYFIDYVDVEYCLRLNVKGYKIVQVNKAKLYHNEANLEIKRFLGKTIYPYNHNPIRFYYKSRNRQYLKKAFYKYFPEYFDKRESKMFRNTLLKVLFFEEKKFQKLKMAWFGFKDYRKGKVGKIPDEYLK